MQSAYSANIPAQKYRDGLNSQSSQPGTQERHPETSVRHPELVSGSSSNGRNAAGTEIGTRYRYIDDTPLVPLTEAGKTNGTSSSGSTAKTRSRPNNEYVLYSYGEPIAMANDSGTSYFGTDILGSVRSVTDKYGAVQADYSYDAFGSPYLGNLENDIGFGYCGKVYDIGTGLYDYGFRDYSPVSARFTTIDPIRDGSNWFSYVVNDPVNYVDPLGLSTSDRGSSPNFNSGMFGQNVGFDGFTVTSLPANVKTENSASTAQTSANGPAEILQSSSIIFMALGGITNNPMLTLTGLGFYLYSCLYNRNDEVGFAARHPVVASDIYSITGHGITNLGTNSVRFACALSLNERHMKGCENEGSQVNAVRHALWSASITSKYGKNIAKEATDSHEPNTSLTGTVFADSLTADSRVDMLNNEIGISIGEKNKNSDMKSLTRDILDYYHTDGLWVTDNNSDGTWSIRKEKLSDQQYNEAIEQLNNCDSNGFN